MARNPSPNHSLQPTRYSLRPPRAAELKRLGVSFMGILCDLFVNTRDEALAYESTTTQNRNERLKRFSPAEFKGLTSLEFGTLWAILANEEWDVEKHMLIDLAFGEANESWLHEFQDEYVGLLSKLDSNAINSAAEAWSKTEELECSADEVRPVIEALSHLSKLAIANNKGLYMWGSL